ncbi:ArnT family glycosyltransferase [Pseudalkalibacillus berkeleyi]|uniref:Glycosyltransferase family 39 protein n=1 Tax=Pseudalkalibacillus berkeleyi TaxID=1069813 RepID=A0ABS9H522_9BACL|nr:glycosyltransferase family 39 protein [Pseudalkalibacillus berkeleyi]MCF6138790.1 glycosyltransferase family 39 protein [Pseudalkalibacillus berkeleyi]
MLNQMNRLLYSRYPLILIIVFSLIVHLLFLIKNPGMIFNDPGQIGFTEKQGQYGGRDATLYAEMARQLLDVGVYGYDTHHTGEVVQNAFVTPGQPIYLVVIFSIANLIFVDQLLLAKLVNMALSVSTVALLYFISYRLFESRWISLSAAFLYSIYLSPLHYFRTTLTEIPSIFMFCLTLLLFLKAYQDHRTRDHVLFGIFFCITVMFRPTPAPLILLAIAAILLKYPIKESVRIGLLWVIGPVVVIAPWVIRNLAAFGELYIFSSHAGNSLFAGANPFFKNDFSEYWREMKAKGWDQEQYAWYKIKQGFKHDFDYWFAWFTVGKTINLFHQVDSQVHYMNYAMLKYFKWIHYFVVVVGIGSTIFYMKKLNVRTIAWIVVGYILLSNMFLTIPRYGFFIIPMLCILTAFTIYQVGYLLTKYVKIVKSHV